MEYDYVYLGCAPTEEDCAQVGSEDYEERSKRETTAFIMQLSEVLLDMGYCPETLPKGFRIMAKTEQHDFGQYEEVVARVDAGDEQAYELAVLLERNLPATWSNLAKKLLGPVSILN